MNPDKPQQLGSMHRFLPLTIGVLLTILASYIGLVAIPDRQVGALDPIEVEGKPYPQPPSEEVFRGQLVYRDLGCVYCHSQQVRHDDFGGDISRGWGKRAGVPRDYIYEKFVFFGTMRTGPDLRNIGVRQPSDTWHYLHLFNPQITSPGSVMPPYPFLFNKLKKAESQEFPADALPVPPGFGVDDYYIMPNQRARNLVSYLKSLQYDLPLSGESEMPEGASHE